MFAVSKPLTAIVLAVPVAPVPVLFLCPTLVFEAATAEEGDHLCVFA
jgi:hypothetical protein